MTTLLIFAGLVGLIFAAATPARAQIEDAAKRHERFVNFLKLKAAEISGQCLSDIHTLEDWRQKRPSIQQELLYMLGLSPLPERTPLNPQITGTLHRPNYRIEKLVFESLPGLYVTGNLYIPHAPSEPLPAILYVCGHSPHPLGAKFHYQERAHWFAGHGYVCLILDTLEFGEAAGIHHGTHNLNLWRWLSQGYTPAGVEVWNAIRALDYLETRPEVDSSHIGMTGISGGGAVTWYTAAVDERIAAAVPVCSTYTFGSQAAHWLAAGQCDCIYFHNTFQGDLTTVGALIAPRPLLIISGQKDGIFPPDGYHDVFRRVKQIYDLYAGNEGGADRIKEVDDDVGHSDTPLFRKEARQWMNRWLKGDEAPVEIEPNPEETKETAEALACLSKLPRDAVNYNIHDLFIPVARLENWTTLPAWEKRRQVLMDELKAKVFRWFPQEEIPFETQFSRSTGGWAAHYADYKEAVFFSEAGVPIRAQLLQPKARSPETPLLIYVKRPGDSIYFLDYDELLPVLGRYAVLIVNPRMTEALGSAAAFTDIERTAAWLGRTVAAMQVWDILRAVEWTFKEEQLSPASVAIYGKGEMGILALYAGLFDARIDQAILNDPPPSHWHGPALLNILRITDIPEAAGAFAPRRLILVKDIPPAFDYTRQIYQLHGRPDHLSRAGSLPEALEIWKY
jgi:cephalosporin-C deacetylase-like acetyl esterase